VKVLPLHALVSVSGELVRLNFFGTDFFEYGGQVLRPCVSVSPKVEVPSRMVGAAHSDVHQHRPLEDEPVRLPRACQSME
jgi:hypothetical protein